MTETIYTLYPVFAATRELRDRFADEKDRARAVSELEELFKRWGDDVRVRGTYSTVGFRSDANLMLWLSAGSAEELQRAITGKGAVVVEGGEVAQVARVVSAVTAEDEPDDRSLMTAELRDGGVSAPRQRGEGEPLFVEVAEPALRVGTREHSRHFALDLVGRGKLTAGGFCK